MYKKSTLIQLVIWDTGPTANGRLGRRVLRTSMCRIVRRMTKIPSIFGLLKIPDAPSYTSFPLVSLS